MKIVRTNTVYRHQGQTLSPKLVYALPDAVADGLVSLGFAAYEQAAADLTLDGLTWDPGTGRGAVVSPDPLTHRQDAR